MKIAMPLNMQGFQLLNVVGQILSGPPSTPLTGQWYYDSTLNSLQFYNGTAWIPFNAALTANGSIAISKLAVDPTQRANQSGTQLSATISDLAPTVKAYTLDTFATPVANLSLGGKGINNLLDPVNPQDAATKNYTDNAVQSASAGIDSKAPCRVVSVANQSTTSGLLTIDGVTLAAGDRVLLTAQTTASQNGVYVASSGTWARAADAAAGSTTEMAPGAFWFVSEGTTYGKTQWRCNNTGIITIGTTAITIVQFGAASMYTGGNGVTLTGTSFSAAVVSGGGLVVAAAGLSVDRTVTPQKYTTTIGDGSTTSYTVTHSLNTQDISVTCRETTSPYNIVFPDYQVATANTVTVMFGTAPASGAYRVTVIG